MHTIWPETVLSAGRFPIPNKLQVELSRAYDQQATLEIGMMTLSKGFSSSSILFG